MRRFIQGSETKSKASASGAGVSGGKEVGSSVMLFGGKERKGMVDDLGHVKLKERTLAGSTSHGWRTTYSLHNCTIRRRGTSSDFLKKSQACLQRSLAAASSGTKA